MPLKILFFALIAATSWGNGELFSDKENVQLLCPHIYWKIFRGFVPRGNLTAGTFTEMPETKGLWHCVRECCVSKCNVAFMTDGKCYHVLCASNELCAPILSPNAASGGRISMVLVKPVVGVETWEDVVEDDAQNEDKFSSNMYNIKEPPYKPFEEILQSEGSNYNYLTGCTVEIPSSCPDNEDCLQNYPKSRAGTCHCKTGLKRNREGSCTVVVMETKSTSSDTTENSNVTTRKPLTVTAESKEVKYPNNEATLTATVEPPPPESDQYQYDWTSLEQPVGSAAVKHQNGGQLQLSKLSEGLYTFKVSVSNSEAFGETFVNVTVLAPSRVNKPPQIIITPANQTIKLPNTGAVLDASSTTDDDGIVSWHWELQQGPLGYQPQLEEKPTLQLNDLKRPGNYTFKLTVTDTDRATNTSIANITILKITDYPPEANAGQDVIIYLPHNQITLNANKSTDDHNITTWEWTKGPGDADKVADMQDTRTPYLRLSDLEEGMYTFILKVTDSANQSSAAEVRVFVKAATNKPPVAEAGDNVTISLPQTWVVVDAGGSTDDNKIVEFKWELVQGPSGVTFVSGNASSTNVTGLTKGSYVFKVVVIDDNRNVASDTVCVTVNQNKNQRPTANAGDDFEVTLPRNVLVLNGSRSSDDWAVVKWHWVRVDSSLALGNIAENTDESPILLITNVVHGTYRFNLTVFDEQGLSDSSSVKVVVKPDPKLYYLVEITIETDVNRLDEVRYKNFKNKLALLIEDGTKLQIRGLKPDLTRNLPVVTFYVETSDGDSVPANDVVQHLRQKLRMDEGLLGFEVVKLQTAICQNNCSGHGSCDEQTRQCVCEAFWMHDLFKVYLTSMEDSDCKWSILYVVLGVICSLVSIVGSLWAGFYFCINWCARKHVSKPTTYKLLEDNDELPPYASRKGNISDSDTDSDVVFESRNKSSRYNSEMRNGHKAGRNGFVKMGRRIKT